MQMTITSPAPSATHHPRCGSDLSIAASDWWECCSAATPSPTQWTAACGGGCCSWLLWRQPSARLPRNRSPSSRRSRPSSWSASWPRRITLPCSGVSSIHKSRAAAAPMRPMPTVRVLYCVSVRETVPYPDLERP